MKKLKFALFLFAAVAYFVSTSCEGKIIEFKGKESSPKIVVNAYLGSSSDTVLIRVSRSLFFTEPQNVPTTLPDADVEVFVNGQSIGKAEHLYDTGIDSYRGGGESFFAVPCQLKTDDKVLVRVKHKDLGEVTAETYVPQPLEIISIQIDSLISWGSYEDVERFTIPVKITFRDNPKKNNFYNISCYRISYNEKGDSYTQNLSMVCADSKIGILNYEVYQISEYDGKSYKHYPSMFFGDSRINGEECTLEFELRDQQGSSSSSSKNDTIIIRFMSYSEDYYKYMVSRYGSGDMMDDWLDVDIFSEPNQVYSNVEGGIGVVCGAVGESRVAIVFTDRPIPQGVIESKGNR